MFRLQQRIPALSNFKAIKAFLKTDLQYCILVDFQLAELKSIIDSIHDEGRKVLIHVDMIKGLSPDEYGAIHLIQNYHVDGLISTKSKVIEVAKKRGKISIYRVFLKDSFSYRRSLDIVKKINPDFIEVLPAISGAIIQDIKDYVGVDVLCGGLLSTEKQILDCIESGAIGVTVSNLDLWVKK